MKKRYSLSALMAVVILVSIFCMTVSAAVPSPSESFYVYDEAEVISADTEELIVSENDRLQRYTGAQIVIAAVKTTGDETIRNFAGKMFTEWGIGDSGKNNGVLVLLAIDDDDYWVTQGSGIEDKLTSGDIKVMLDKYLEASFAAKDYDNGVKALFNNLISTFESIYYEEFKNEATASPDTVNANADGNIVTSVLTGFIVVVAVVIFIIIIFVAVRGMSHTGYTRGPSRPTVFIPPGRVGRPPVRRPSSRPGARPGGSGMPPRRPPQRPGGMGGMNRPGARPGGMSGSRPGGSRPRSGGGGSTRGGGAGRR